MRLPIICVDDRLANYLQQFRSCFSKPQHKYFVTILVGLMLCQSGSTMTNLLRQVETGVSLSGSSRFLAQAPWSENRLVSQWLTSFRSEMVEKVRVRHKQLKAKRPKRRGRPRKTVVTGYLIGDDSAMQKRRGKKMQALGRHHSSTENRRVTGHCLVQALYVLLGRRCPLEPLLYAQKAVCQQEGVPFKSKIELMIEHILHFEPVAETETHLLLDSWYTAKKVWQAARQRGFLVTSGLKSNRRLRIETPNGKTPWRWQELGSYADSLPATAFSKMTWPGSDRQVYVHVVSTRVKKLYRCQVVLVRETLDGKTRFWGSTDLAADPATLLEHIAQRWDIEVLFADVKELLGIDQYQLMSRIGIRRFWILVMLGYTFLDQERDRLQQQSGRHTTIGDAKRHIRKQQHRNLVAWLHDAITRYNYSPEEICEELVA